MYSVQPVFPKILLVTYDFNGAGSGDRPVRQLFGWNDPFELTDQFIHDLQSASANYCNYEIVESQVVDGFPVKVDGFRYTKESYSKAWQSRSDFHQPDWADYDEIVETLNLSYQIRSKEIDEVWLFAGPYAGFYESRMAGPGAFWCNAPPLEGYRSTKRRFVIMGFNYERGVGEMLESYGHRVESIMDHVYRRKRGASNLWKRYTRYHRSHPGQAEVGNVHFAPNSRHDYDWGNMLPVPSRCDNWLNFPYLSGRPKLVNSSEWGKGDIRQHHLWWLRHLPHVEGITDGIANNWWEYIVDPNRVD
ncbi:MAG: hypothetical protein BMS9Abin02_1232 [Anaerolineae bacterium]|nr:MAG: hypothetical protein BMS9Abin02_1232 [Anaerolineae bacterium]